MREGRKEGQLRDSLQLACGGTGQGSECRGGAAMFSSVKGPHTLDMGHAGPRLSLFRLKGTPWVTGLLPPPESSKTELKFSQQKTPTLFHPNVVGAN